jgi:hypothetical protein
MEAKGESKYDDDDAKGGGGGGAKGGASDDAKGDADDRCGDDAKGGGGDDAARDDLLRKVFDFYYENNELEEALQKFAFENAGSFDDEHRRTGEYLLEHTELHARFRSLFEAKMEAFVTRQGVSVSEFYRTVASDQARSTELYSGHTFAAVINSTMKFENFYELMQDAKRGEFYWGVPLLQDMETLEFLF